MSRHPIVLCVGADPLVAGTLAGLLRRAGAQVLKAPSGQEALAALASPAPRPDLILAELDGSPGGEAFLRALRADPRLAPIPVIPMCRTVAEQPADPSLPRAFAFEDVLHAVRILWPRSGPGGPS